MPHCARCKKEIIKTTGNTGTHRFCSAKCRSSFHSAFAKHASGGGDDLSKFRAKLRKGNDAMLAALDASTGGFESYNVKPAAKRVSRPETITGTGESSAAWAVGHG